MLTTYDDIIGKPATQQNAPQQAAETTAQAATPQAGVATQVAATPVTNTAAAPAGTATQQTTQATQAVAQPTQQKTPMSYADMFVAMNPYKPMTPEERAAEAKRNRRNAMFAAISDGISALSNLYFTTKGAPNSFNGGSTLSGKMYERQRQLEKEREAMDKDYINGYIRAMEMDRNRDNAERNYQQQLKQFEYNMQRNKAADERAERELVAKENYYGIRNRKEEAKAEQEEKKAKKQDELLQSQINRYNRTGTGRGGNTSRKVVTVPVGGGDITLPSTLSRQDLYNLAAQRLGIETTVTTGTGKNKKESQLPASVIETKVRQNPQGEQILRDIAIERGGSFNEIGKTAEGTPSAENKPKPTTTVAPWRNKK